MTTEGRPASVAFTRAAKLGFSISTPRDSADVKGTMFIDLGKLRAFKGSQTYSIPAGLNLRNYSSVVIWCAEFGVLISPADLEFAS